MINLTAENNNKLLICIISDVKHHATRCKSSECWSTTNKLNLSYVWNLYLRKLNFL